MGTCHFPPLLAHLLHRSVPTSNAKFSSGAFFRCRLQGSGTLLASKGRARYTLRSAFASSHPYTPTRTLPPCRAAGQNFHSCFLFNQILKLADSKVRAVKARAIFIGPFSTTASPEKFVSLRAFHMTCLSVICKLGSSQEGLIQSGARRKKYSLEDSPSCSKRRSPLARVQ